MHFRKAIQDFTAVDERDVPPLESKAERSNDRDSELVLISFSDFKADYMYSELCYLRKKLDLNFDFEDKLKSRKLMVWRDQLIYSKTDR